MAIIIFLGLAVLVIIIFVIVGENAPFGYEDETGFHYGKKPE